MGVRGLGSTCPFGEQTLVGKLIMQLLLIKIKFIILFFNYLIHPCIKVATIHVMHTLLLIECA